jgi:hypothetical protein
MYYKVIQNHQIIDVLFNPIYIKWTNRLVSCPLKEARGVLSSDKQQFWNVEGFPILPIPTSMVRLVEIT